MFAALAFNTGILALPRSRPSLPGAFRRGLAGLAGLVRPSRYRPERHYMRGGNTEGSRNLAMARARIAGRG
ncbi:hypothetical protein ACFQS7_24005 [Dankookia sp. GCM10030260]|uniref:hypothetical protein n=1 Tax=Dankookia sp. GCM10030260 TaxID=3273390 RepID=UPI003622EAF8